MATGSTSNRYRILRKNADDLIRIVERDGTVVALVTAGRIGDACAMAAWPELVERLTEVRHLRQKDGKRGKLLLPPDLIASIDKTLARARPKQ